MSRKSGSFMESWVLVNLGIIALVAFALWFTHDVWAILGLVFMFATRTSAIDTQCPKCNCNFVATERESESTEDK
jgi:hypothetical protein